jgi:hypothetical protein
LQSTVTNRRNGGDRAKDFALNRFVFYRARNDVATTLFGLVAARAQAVRGLKELLGMAAANL